MSTLRKLLLLSLPLGVPVLLAQGCYSGNQVIEWECPENGGPAWEKYCNKDAGAEDAGDAGESDGSTTQICPGTCVQKAPKGWSEPVPHWFGPTKDAPPECPTVLSSAKAERLYAELEPGVPLECAACQCGVSTGECAEVPEKIVVSSVGCFDSGGSTLEFSGPAGWHGECTAENAIPGGLICDNGPCAVSIRSASIVATVESCEAFSDGPPVKKKSKRVG